MKTNRQTLGIIIFVLGLIILILIIYFGFFLKNPEESTVVTETPGITGQLPGGQAEPTTTPGDRPRGSQVYDITKEAEHKFNQNDLAKLGEVFAERFGSYSNYSNFSNFTDLKIMMTKEMQDWSDGYVAKLRAATSTDDSYRGLTTTAAVSKVNSFDDKAGTGQVTVTTRRLETTGQATEGASYYQDIRINFKKVNGDWLADKAVWLDKK